MLDACTSLAVCAKETQVIAVGLRNGPDKSQHLFAENGVTNPMVITYTEEI